MSREVAPACVTDHPSLFSLWSVCVIAHSLPLTIFPCFAAHNEYLFLIMTCCHYSLSIVAASHLSCLRPQPQNLLIKKRQPSHSSWAKTKRIGCGSTNTLAQARRRLEIKYSKSILSDGGNHRVSVLEEEVHPNREISSR